MLKALTGRQREVLLELRRFYDATGEQCSERYLARRLKLSRSTVRDHLEAIHRKGYLVAPTTSKPQQRG